MDDKQKRELHRALMRGISDAIEALAPGGWAGDAGNLGCFLMGASAEFLDVKTGAERDRDVRGGRNGMLAHLIESAECAEGS